MMIEVMPGAAQEAPIQVTPPRPPPPVVRGIQKEKKRVQDKKPTGQWYDRTQILCEAVLSGNRTKASHHAMLFWAGGALKQRMSKMVTYMCTMAKCCSIQRRRVNDWYMKCCEVYQLLAMIGGHGPYNVTTQVGNAYLVCVVTVNGSIISINC